MRLFADQSLLQPVECLADRDQAERGGRSVQGFGSADKPFHVADASPRRFLFSDSDHLGLEIDGPRAVERAGQIECDPARPAG